MTKQGMIGYLWHHWKSANISYDDIQKTTGRLDTAIRLWMQNDYDWDDLLDRYGEILDHRIE